MNDMIEDIICELITDTDPSIAARILTRVLYSVEDGYDILESIDIECEYAFG